MSRLLTICPYDLIPLRGGGALRSFHLLRQLARFHEIHAILFQPEASLRKEAEGYKVPDNVKIYSPIDTPPPPTTFSRLPSRLGNALYYRWLRRSWAGPANRILLQSWHLFGQILKNHRIDVVLFEGRDAMCAAPWVRRLAPHVLQILDAHNVDHKLLHAQATRAGQIEDSARQVEVERTRRDEERMGRSVHAFFACSKEDRDQLVALSGIPGCVVPNGVDTKYFAFDSREEKAKSRSILFTGSLQYPPNVDGLVWFLDEIWPLLLQRVPGVEFIVAGAGASAELQARLRSSPQVRFVGEVPDMRPVARQAGVAVCPLRIGSGTRLKILEYMSWGTPVVSTRIGAEGIEARHGEEIVLEDAPERFADAVLRLMNDAELFHRMRNTARKLAETRYDWDRVGAMAAAAIEDQMSNRRS